MTAFLSYRRVDTDKVTALKDALVAKGVDVWIDRESIAPGVDWDPKIYDAIKEASYFVACFSLNTSDEATFGITYMYQEVQFAIGLVPARPEGWLIPVLLDECEIPAIPVCEGKTIHAYQRVSVAGSDWRTGVDQLAETIGKLKKEDARARLRGFAEKVREAQRQLAHDEAWCECGHLIDPNLESIRAAFARKALAQQTVEAKRREYEGEYNRYVAIFREEFHPYGELLKLIEEERTQEFERVRDEVRRAQEGARPFKWLIVVVMILVVSCAIAVAEFSR
jgi:hypothetical protein